ncbi:MAG: alpha/beta hydrolase [Pseudomonadales bacterium]|nr:alpha/beta hydrolase [Pseudomonadales bacterium]
MDRIEFEVEPGLLLVGDRLGTRSSPTAPTVLLAHGGGQTRGAWGGTAQALAAAGHRAIMLDLRGHGESGWAPHGDYATARFAADLVAVARCLEGPVVLVGASLGGLAGMLAEGELAPGTFSRMVFVDVAPQLEPEGVAGIVGFMRAHLDEGFATLDDAADAIERYLPQRRGRRNPEGLRRNLRLGADGRWRWHWDPRFMAPSASPQGTDHRDRLERALASIEVPVLLVRGRMSELVSEAGVAAFLRCAPHGKVVDVAGAGHMVAGDRNDAFTDAVVEFIS